MFEHLSWKVSVEKELSFEKNRLFTFFNGHKLIAYDISVFFLEIQ
jgi:hypothetical protein